MVKHSIYTPGGTVQAGKGIYLSRVADDQLLQLCRASEFAYVLTSRQMGKSSLMIQTAFSLREEGILPIIIDLTEIGAQGMSADTWYRGLLFEIEAKLEQSGYILETDTYSWWQSHEHLTFTQRFIRFFRSVLLEEVSQQIVVFIDEIDTSLSLDFTDDFFIAIRSFYTTRAQDPSFKRLSFVLIGVATPSDLILDARRTPFNIGHRVDLTDFTLEEASPLADGLELSESDSQRAMEWILEWTGGHPYLTQCICIELTRRCQTTWTKPEIDTVVREIFLSEKGEQDNNLQFVRNMLIKRTSDLKEVLKIYLEILQEKKTVLDDGKSVSKSHLKLSGIVKPDKGKLKARNSIYKKVFTAKWARSYLAIYRLDLRLTISSTVLATLLLLMASSLQIFNQLEKITFDYLLRLRPAEEPDPRITIVSITEDDIQTIAGDDVQDLETYSIPDGILADLLHEIALYHPRTIGLNINRDIPVEPGHDELKDIIQSLDNLVVVDKISPPVIESPPYVQESHIGFSDILVDSDDSVRRSLLGMYDAQNTWRFSFAIPIVRHYLATEEIEMENGIKDSVTMRFGTVELPRINGDYAGKYSFKEIWNIQTLINFRSGPTPFNIITYRDIQTSNFSPDLLKDSVVLIGITTQYTDNFISIAAIDRRTNGRITGTELQAHAISQILSAVLDYRPLIWVWSFEMQVLIIVFCSSIGGLIAWYFQKPLRFLAVIFFAGSGFIVISFSMLILIGLWLPIVLSLTGFALTTTVISVLSLMRRDVKKAVGVRFSNYPK